MMSFVKLTYCHWSVWPVDGGPILAWGKAKSYDQAFRNARNYIRNHQNEVYGP